MEFSVTDWSDEQQVRVHIKGESEGWVAGAVDAEFTNADHLYLKDGADTVWVETASIDAAEY